MPRITVTANRGTAVRPFGRSDSPARCVSWSCMTAGVPMSRCRTASSSTATTCGGLTRSRMACRSIRAATSSSARSSSSPAATNSALAYPAVWSSPGIRIGDHKRSACAARSASSQFSNQLGIGPSVRRANAAHRPNSSRSRPQASHHASSTSSVGGRSPVSPLATTVRSKPNLAASASWLLKLAALRPRVPAQRRGIPVPAARDELQAKLYAVTAEQDSRSRLAGA